MTLLQPLWAMVTLCILGGTGCAWIQPETPGPRTVTGESGWPREPRSIEIQVDLKEVEELQRAFEEGHQPWRGDPLFAAYVAIEGSFAGDLRYEDLKVERETEREAIVAGKGTRHRYRVRLRRLVAPRAGEHGIWTAVRIEYDLGRN